jgi:hypothetical protein
MKKRLLILCLGFIILISGCSYLIHEAQKESIGKLSKKDIVIKYGVPYKELQTSGLDVLQYRTWCGHGRDSYYCELREFFFDKDILVNDVIKFEYFAPKEADAPQKVK